MGELANHIYSRALNALETTSADERADIYAVSFFVYDEEDDPRRPTVTVGFNTEADVARELQSTDEREARWNYAFWRQNQLAVICDTDADPAGARLRDAWIREQGLWFEVPENEEPMFDERGEPLTAAFVELLVNVVRRLHADNIARVFGRAIPVLIHELEYHEGIARQNLEANPAGVVPDDFVSWCRGG